MDPDLRTFLQQRLITRMTTIAPDGYPHTVPVWYMLDGDDILLATGYHTRKVKHIRANPRGSLVFGGEPLDRRTVSLSDMLSAARGFFPRR